MAQRETQRSWGWIWALVAVAAGLIVFLVLHFNQPTVTVRTAQVERQDIVSTVSTNGKVEPIDDFQAHASGPGVVDKIYVTLGEHVQPGQALLKMNDTDPLRDIASAQASIDSATSTMGAMQQGGTAAELITAKADLAQGRLAQQQDVATLSALKKLQAQGAASANEVAAAQQRLQDSQVHLDQLQSQRTGRYSAAEMAAQRAQIAQGQATLAAARRGYANVDVKAPFAGTVYSIPVQQYDFLQAGQALLDVADLNKLQIRAYFDEPEIGRLKAGQPVKIVWDAKPNLVWHGHIVVAPTTIIGYGTRNVGEALISVDDAKGDLLPNTNVTVSVTTLFQPDVLSLPREALHTDGSSDFVYRVVNDHLVRTSVQVGSAINLTRFEVAGGLNQGEVVALGATTDVDLTNGLHVSVLP